MRSEKKLFDKIEETGRKWSYISGEVEMDNKNISPPTVQSSLGALYGFTAENYSCSF